jgi:hypothetical protein
MSAGLKFRSLHSPARRLTAGETFVSLWLLTNDLVLVHLISVRLLEECRRLPGFDLREAEAVNVVKPVTDLTGSIPGKARLLNLFLNIQRFGVTV